MRQFRQLLFCLVWVLSLFGRASAASHRVELALEGPPSHHENAQQAVKEALKGLDIDLLLVPQSPTAAQAVGGEGGVSSSLARVRVNLDQNQLRLVVVDRDGTGIYVRTIPLSPARAALAYEQLTQILRSTVAAMMEQELLLPDRGPPSETDGRALPAPPASERTVVASWGFDWGVAGSALLYSQELVILRGAEVQSGLRWGRERHHVIARLSVGYRTARFRSPEISFGIQHVPLLMSLGHRVEVGGWRLESLFGGGVAFIGLRSRTAARGFEVLDGSALRVANLRLGLRLERRLSGPWSTFFEARADFDPSETRLVLEDEGQYRAVVSPLVVQPSMAVGLSFGK